MESATLAAMAGVVACGLASRPFDWSRRVSRRPSLCQDLEYEIEDEEVQGRRAHAVPRPQGNMCFNDMDPLYIPLRRDDRARHLEWLQSIWNINFASVFHVAFYAWSAIEVTEILFELGQLCPNLQSITIGYTVLQGLPSRTLQDALWCGVDYPSRTRSSNRVTPDLKFFATIFRQSAACNQEYCLKASQIPRFDEVMQPWAENNQALGLTSFHKFFHNRQNLPTIRVVNVPLIPSDKLPDRGKVARKLRFLSPTNEWAKESHFAQRKPRDSIANDSFERRSRRMKTDHTRTLEPIVSEVERERPLLEDNGLCLR